MLWTWMLACTPEPIEVEPEPPRELQLEEGFHRTLTRAYGCDEPVVALGLRQTNSALFDDTGSLRVTASESAVTVSLGQALLNTVDDDPCDDVVIVDGSAERWMTYAADEATQIRMLQDDGVRVYELYDVVLEPVDSDYADPADYQPLELDRLILGAIVLGGDLEELR